MDDKRLTLNLDRWCESYGRILCVHGLRNYVTLPVSSPATIELVYTEKATPDSFKMLPNGFLMGVATYLLLAFRAANSREYTNGYKYVHVEYDV